MNRLLFTSVVLCVLIMIGCSSRNIDPLYNFTTFCAQYGKTYQEQEAKRHEEIFKQNYKQYLNRTGRGEDLAVNERMDWN